MGRQRLNSRMPRLALAALTLVTLVIVACNGDGEKPAGGSPSPNASPGAGVTPTVTPGSGDSPAVAVGTYIEVKGLGGHHLDINKQAECPLEEVQTVTAGTPTIISRAFLGQFCLAARDWIPDTAITIIVDLPDTGESWKMKLEFDSKDSLWKVKDIKKVSG